MNARIVASSGRPIRLFAVLLALTAIAALCGPVLPAPVVAAPVAADVEACPPRLYADDFNRANGVLGGADCWMDPDNIGGYKIRNQQVNVNAGGLLIWMYHTGPRQAVVVDLVRIDPRGRHHTLALKMHQPNLNAGVILVSYDGRRQLLYVEEAHPGQDGYRKVWSKAYTMVDGDQLGARAWEDGSVSVYVNGVEQGRTEVIKHFVGLDGWVGLWFHRTGGAVIDNFVVNPSLP